MYNFESTDFTHKFIQIHKQQGMCVSTIVHSVQKNNASKSDFYCEWFIIIQITYSDSNSDQTYILIPAGQSLFEGLWRISGTTVSDDDGQSAYSGPGVSRVENVRASGLQRIVGECTSSYVRQVLQCKF